MNWKSWSGILCCSILTASASAADLALKVTDKAPSSDLDSSFTALLQPKAIQLVDGDKPAFEFWFCKEVTLDSKPESDAKAMDSLKQAQFLGAVTVAAGQKDYRDDDLPAGVYTMRYCLQPTDGNHQGTADFGYFVLLTSTKNDPKLDALANYKAVVKASGKDSPNEHPHVISLRPPSSTEGDSPKLMQPLPDHKSIRIKIPAKAGGDKADLLFELVYQGHGHK